MQLNVEHDASIKYDAIEKSFKGYVYPNIRTAIVSRNAVAFLMTCPESRHVDSYEFNYRTSLFWTSAARYCRQLEVGGYNSIIPIDLLPGISYLKNLL